MKKRRANIIQKINNKKKIINIIVGICTQKVGNNREKQ